MTRGDDRHAAEPSWASTPGPSRRTLVALLIAGALAGSAFNLVRVAFLAAQPIDPTYHGLCAPSPLLARERLSYAPGLCLIELDDDGWRPLRVEVPLRAREGEADAGLQAPGSGLQARNSVGHASSARAQDVVAQIGVNAGPLEPVHVDTSWTTKRIEAPPRAPLATRIVIRIEMREQAVGGTPPIEVGPVSITRVRTGTRTFLDATIGAIGGMLAAFVVAPLATRSARGGPGRPKGLRYRGPVAQTFRSASLGFAGLALALTAYFGVWALLRPPYQTPDEVQHHLRASSVLRYPWIASGGEWTLDPRFTNPLALWTPPSLDKLFFHPDRRLTRLEIATLEAVPWPASSARPAPETYRRAIASYPTLYYWPLFMVAEPVTRVLSLSPYQSAYAYRFASACLAALLWAAVYRTLRRTEATREVASPLLAFLVLNPMVAFMSSAINPDAVTVPLATLAVLLLWRVLTNDRGRSGDATTAALAWVALVAAAWTKPSGLQVIVSLGVTLGLRWAIGQVTALRPERLEGRRYNIASRELRLAGAVVAGAAVVAWCGFYAWSPLRLLGGAPLPDRLITYLGQRWANLSTTWVGYWGTLGWLEYSLPAFWYQALFALIAVSLVCVLLRPQSPRLFAGYTALFLVAFLAVTLAGEFVYLSTAGYVLQGRHLLPASIGLAWIVLHRVRAVRLALLAFLVAMNIALLHQTVLRYYTRGWSAVVASLPFGTGQVGK